MPALRPLKSRKTSSAVRKGPPPASIARHDYKPRGRESSRIRPQRPRRTGSREGEEARALDSSGAEIGLGLKTSSGGRDSNPRSITSERVLFRVMDFNINIIILLFGMGFRVRFRIDSIRPIWLCYFIPNNNNNNR